MLNLRLQLHMNSMVSVVSNVRKLHDTAIQVATSNKNVIGFASILFLFIANFLSPFYLSLNFLYI